MEVEGEEGKGGKKRKEKKKNLSNKTMHFFLINNLTRFPEASIFDFFFI